MRNPHIVLNNLMDEYQYDTTTLAKELGVFPTNVVDFLTGEYTVTRDWARRLASVFPSRYTVEQWLDREEY
jgi:plasmid maintenance system antidote protein VapI